MGGIAAAIAYADAKGIPIVESWLHTDADNMGSVLLQIGAKELQKTYPALSKNDATTTIQNAQHAARTNVEAPAK